MIWGRFVFISKWANVCRLFQEHANISKLETLVLEVNQANRKLLFLGVYKLPNQKDVDFLDSIDGILDYYSENYENVTIVGDFYITTENTHLQSITQAYNLNNMINEPICFQSNQPPPENSSHIKKQRKTCIYKNMYVKST